MRWRPGASSGLRPPWPSTASPCSLRADVRRRARRVDGLSGRFTIGPLTEVAAQHHTWDELAPVLDRGPRAAFVAHERVLRGEDVRRRHRSPAVLELPLDLQPWEPAYSLAVYGDVGADSRCRTCPTTGPRSPPHRPRNDSTTTSTSPCASSSNRGWRAPTASSTSPCVEGDVAAAIGAIGVRHARVVVLDPAAALGWIAWAGPAAAPTDAGGGGVGSLRCVVVLATLGDLAEAWPVPPDDLGRLATELTWYRWDAFEPALGWSLQLAIADEANGTAWAITARDAV